MMKGGLAGLMKQAQKVQENMQRAQESLALIDVEGQSGNGTLKIIGTANRDIRRVSIDESLMQDREMLEDLLLVALKDFNQKIESISQQQMAGVTGGLGLPPGLKLPF
ncbi:MAG: YbaB/EbfC family nucleoid-associated protein [Betaproteobacteria bacterium]|nr:YbaB/EbfC family nucleoid-associated protein [Betaproteobacteria bacterium]